MRKIYSLVVVLPVLALITTGCPKKGGDAADAAPEAEPAAAVAEAAAPAPVAKNAADVSRFGAEKAIANEAAKIIDAQAVVKTGPNNQGTNVAVLKAGTDVTKIADHQNSFLITFADPKEPATLLMGWVNKGVFVADAVVDAGPRDAAVDAKVDAAVAVVDAGAAVAKCAAGQELIIGLGPAPICKKKCAADANCKDKAAGSCVPGTAQGGKVVRFCNNE